MTWNEQRKPRVGSVYLQMLNATDEARSDQLAVLNKTFNR